MTTISAVEVKKTRQSRLPEVDFKALEFGKYVSDHMLVCDYRAGEWQAPAVVPFADISMSPTTLALHYGQTVFEGMKAFRMEDGRINIFRADRHYDRFTKSLDRMCMAVPPRELFMEGLSQLISTDADWVPAADKGSLYIRPFIFATEARFGVKVSEEYKFIIFTGPVPPLFSRPLRLKVETEFVRAARGGTGSAKCGGNYGGAFYPTQLAREAGYDQVLWTDARDHAFIEESGMMNAMFVIGGKLVTAPLSDSILDGVTRDSLLTLARDMDIPVEERPIAVSELEAGFASGAVTEAFGAGTAAVVAPIGVIGINGKDYSLPAITASSVSTRLKKKIDRVRDGIDPDAYGWNWMV